LHAGKSIAKEDRESSFLAAYSSDLSRARETAEIILKEMAEAGIQAPELRTDVALRERCFGECEGRPVPAFAEESKAGYEAQGVAEQWMYTPEGGETVEEVNKRAESFWQVRNPTEKC